VVVSAEALFTLTDLVGLPVADAIESACKTAATITRAAYNTANRQMSKPQKARTQARMRQ
jgi:hypothetical protein